MAAVDLGAVCGEKTAQLLTEHLGDRAHETLLSCNMPALLRIPGLGKKKALSLVHKTYEATYGEDIESLVTESAHEVYERVLERLGTYVVTEDAKTKLYAYFPIKDPDRIAKRQEYFAHAEKAYRGVTDAYHEVARLLKGIGRITMPEKKRFYEYVVITDSDEAMPLLKNPYCDVLFMGSPEEAEYAKTSYSFVIYVNGPDSRLGEYGEQYADRVLSLEDFDAQTLVPDVAVEAFLANEKTLHALERMLALLGKGEPFLGELCELLVLYRNKDAAHEKKIDPDAFVDLVKDKEREVNKRLRDTITEGKIGITSSHFLELISSIGSCDDPGEAVRRSLPAEFDELYTSIVGEALREISERTGLDASRLFPSSFSYPVAIDSEKLYDLRGELASSDFKAQYHIKRKIARYARHWNDIHRLLQDVVEYDFQLGMGRWITETACTTPSLDAEGISFEGAQSIFFDASVPVSYKIGVTPHAFATEEHVAVLTGANSGGKTTLLETTLACQVLAQMGLPVPARSMHTCCFDKIRYQAKAKSQNAGAFETTLSRLVPLATERGKRLILIDELESITEPGSAARIIAALIETMQHEKDAYAIIVTHLGEEIASLCTVRVDGIEARGLDDDLNLVVDRQPAFGTIGRSTPELIVEKLYRKAKGPERAVYEAMLQRIRA